MKKKIYLLLMLLVTCLIYEQSFGLNTLLIALLWIGFNYYQQPAPPSKAWIIAATLWILAGLGNSLWYLDIGIPLYMIAGLNYFAINYHPKISFPISILQSIISWATGTFRFFRFKIGDFNQSSDLTQKIIKKGLLFIIPIFISFIFLKLYQAANPRFAELTAFINLDFIEWPFFLLYFFLIVFFYGCYCFKPSKKILDLDLNTISHLKQAVKSSDKPEDKSFEWQIGIILVSMLSILLVAFILIDIDAIIQQSNGELSHSQAVHQGINILIVSIILVIIIVVVLYRGSNNFESSKRLNILSYGWLSLNAVLIILIAIKNFNYIHDWGLTHKRIGVYVYLLMCIIGLAFTWHKIYAKTSVSFLISKTTTTFLGVLIFYGLFNWNGIITKYNLNSEHLAPHKVDLYYLALLGPESLDHIKKYIKENKLTNRMESDVIYIRLNRIREKYSKGWKSIPSYKLGGYLAYKRLNLEPKDQAGR